MLFSPSSFLVSHRRLVTFLTGVMAIGLSAAPGWAHSGSTSPTCSSCHGNNRAGAALVTNYDLTANPAEMNGKTDRGALKVYQFQPGQTRTLTFQVAGLSTNDKFAGVFKGFDATGVVNGGTLNFTGDTNGWTYSAGSPPWDYTPTFTYAGTKTLSFNLKVNAGTPQDYYDMDFMMGDGTAGAYSEEHFYVQVLPEPATLGMLAAGMGVMLWRRRARRLG
jgi:hypothetical protein